MKWTLQFPILVYTVDQEGEMEPADQQTAPLAVRNAIAESMWSLGQALARTADAITVGAEIVCDDSLGNGGKHGK